MKNVNFGQYEIMDRVSCITSMLDDNVYNHFALTRKQKKKVSKALELLMDVYQSSGEIFYNSIDKK